MPRVLERRRRPVVSMVMSRRAEAIRIVVLCMAAALFLIPAGKVGAQGFRSGLPNALPGPVSSLELSRFVSMMNLTAEQMRAWSGMHDRYKIDFKALSEPGGAVVPFIEARQATEGVPFRAQPPRAVLERWLNAHEAACTSIRTLDERLFEELLPVLSEEQQPLLQRARLSRERQRLAGDELVREWLDPATQADACEVFAKLEADGTELTPEQRAAAWGVLDAYQAQFVAKLREIQSAVRDMHREWGRLLEERGVPVNAVDLSKRDNMDREMFMLVSRAWTEVTTKVKPRLIDLTKFNRAQAKSTASILPPDAASAFLREHMALAYPGEMNSLLNDHEQMLRRVVASPDLNDVERQAVQAQLDGCRRTLAALSERAADAQDLKAEGQRPSQQRGSAEATQQLEQVLAESRDAAAKLSAALAEVLGPERLKVFQMAGSDDRLRRLFREGGVSDPRQVEEMVAEAKRTGSIRFGKRDSLDGVLPDALDMADADALIAPFNLTDEKAGVARQLHSEYVRQYRKQLDDTSTAIGRLGLGGVRSRPDGKGGVELRWAPPEDVEKARTLETQSLAAMRGLDAAFFDDVTAALGLQEAALWRAKLARDWTVLARGERRGNADLRTYEAYVRIPSIVSGMGLSSEHATKADDVLRTRADEFRAVASAHFEANRAAFYSRQMALALDMGPGYPKDENAQAKEREAVELETEANIKRAALAAIVRSILDELVAALPAHADALHDGYDRAAYPSVFTDSKKRSDAMSRALAMDGLSDEQRSELQSAAATLRPAMRDVQQRMIEVNREWDKPRPYSEFRDPARDEIKLKWDQLVFERDELLAGAAATLERVLTPEQRSAIGLETAK